MKSQPIWQENNIDLIPNRKKLTVLVVDESGTETPITHAMQYAGHHVVQVCRAFEALRALEAYNLDLIFIDLGGQPLENFATAELIVQFEKARASHIPVIALGPDIHPLMEERCKNAGIHCLSGKSSMLSELTLFKKTSKTTLKSGGSYKWKKSRILST